MRQGGPDGTAEAVHEGVRGQGGPAGTDQRPDAAIGCGGSGSRPSARSILVDQAKEAFPVHRLCRVLGVSQSGYFAWKNRPASDRQRQDMVLLAHIRSSLALSNATYGSPCMTRELRDNGLAVGRRRTARLMRENGLVARQKRRFKRTTDSEHAGPVAPNLLEQDFAAARPDEKWGADISCVWTREGWLYLAVVIDLFSRRVVGEAAQGSNRIAGGIAAKVGRQRTDCTGIWRCQRSGEPWQPGVPQRV